MRDMGILAYQHEPYSFFFLSLLVLSDKTTQRLVSRNSLDPHVNNTTRTTTLMDN